MNHVMNAATATYLSLPSSAESSSASYVSYLKLMILLTRTWYSIYRERISHIFGVYLQVCSRYQVEPFQLSWHDQEVHSEVCKMFCPHDSQLRMDDLAKYGSPRRWDHLQMYTLVFLDGSNSE